MLSLKISAKADDDLLSIWLHIAQDSTVNADNFIDKLEDKAQLLTTNPYIGRARDELSAGIYSHPVDRYNLYYQVDEHLNQIVLVRVLHSSRDISTLF